MAVIIVTKLENNKFGLEDVTPCRGALHCMYSLQLEWYFNACQCLAYLHMQGCIFELSLAFQLWDCPNWASHNTRAVLCTTLVSSGKRYLHHLHWAVISLQPLPVLQQKHLICWGRLGRVWSHRLQSTSAAHSTSLWSIPPASVFTPPSLFSSQWRVTAVSQQPHLQVW